MIRIAIRAYRTHHNHTHPDKEVSMSNSRDYGAPQVKDLGTVQELTANDGLPIFVDVPQGTPVLGNTIVGSDPNPTATPGPMS